MPACTFFGHRECVELDKGRLREEIEKLIAQGVDTFYVGNQGQFDAAVRSVLHQLSQAYPQIRYGVVLAYLPKPGQPQLDNTMFPEELEGVPPKFAIDRRNKWMLKNSDYVICYLRYSWGGAYKFARMAQKSGKPVIQLNSRGGS